MYCPHCVTLFSNQKQIIMTNQDLYNIYDNPNSGYFEVQLSVISETEKAICFNTYYGDLNHIKKTWIPKSQMKIIDLGENAGTRYFIKNFLSNKF